MGDIVFDNVSIFVLVELLFRIVPVCLSISIFGVEFIIMVVSVSSYVPRYGVSKVYCLWIFPNKSISKMIFELFVYGLFSPLNRRWLLSR